MDNEKLRELCGDEFARALSRHVLREFEAKRALPDDVAEIPYIGGTYRPHAPLEKHAALRARVGQPLFARQWHEYDAPPWAQPLPLSIKECQPLFNSTEYRLQVLARYAMQLRLTDWDIRHAKPFAHFYRSQKIFEEKI